MSLTELKTGNGLEERISPISSCAYRAKLMLILTLSYTLVALLGEASEQLGFGKKLKVNTVKIWTHSLFRQEPFYYKFFYRFTQEKQNLLMDAFQKTLAQIDFWCHLLAM